MPSDMALLSKVMDHEIRTPLQTIVTFLHILDADLPGEDPTLRQAAHEACDYLRLLHKDLVLALDELGTHVPKPGATVQEIVGWVLTRGEPLAESRSMTIRTRAENGEMLALAQEPWLRYALWNLLRNALTHGPEGGTVDLVWRRTSSHDHIAIRDDGHGPGQLRSGRLRGSDVAALYGPHENRVRGLALTAVLSERLGGFLTFDRPAQQGARFTLTLPTTRRSR